MMRKRRTNLKLEQLEDRWCPALTIAFNGSLSVTGNPTGVVSVDGNGTNWTVNDGANVLGTYAVTGNISIATSNASDTVNVRANGGAATVPGNLTISSGNGNDLVQVNHTSNNTLTVGGMATIQAGLGGDTINFGTANLVRVNGVAIINGDTGADTMTIGSAGADQAVFSSDVVIMRVNTITTNGATYNGNVSVINNLDNAVANTLTVGAGRAVTVNGTLTYVGGSAGDTVSLSGVYNGTTGSSTNINSFDGTNSLSVGPAAAAATLMGSLNYNGGSGADTIDFGDSSYTVAGNVTLNVGDGDNVYDLVAAAASSVFGSFTLNAGNGADAVGSQTNLSVFGNVRLNMGHGANSVTFDGAFSGASVAYVGGSGVDGVTLNVAGAAYNLSVSLGAGVDTFTYGANVTTLGSAVIDGGVDADNDTYTQTAPAAIFWPQVLKNFP